MTTKNNIHVGPVKEKQLFAGKYYELYMTGETLEVCPTEHAKEHLYFTLSQTREMIGELSIVRNELARVTIEAAQEDKKEKEYEVEVGRTITKTQTFKVRAYDADEACLLARNEATGADFNNGSDNGDPDYEIMNCDEVE